MLFIKSADGTHLSARCANASVARAPKSRGLSSYSVADGAKKKTPSRSCKAVLMKQVLPAQVGNAHRLERLREQELVDNVQAEHKLVVQR